MNRFLVHDLALAAAKPDPDGKLAEAGQLIYKFRAGAIAEATSEFVNSVASLAKELSVFELTVPVGVGKSLISAMPHFDASRYHSAAWGIPIVAAVTAYKDHNPEALSRAIRDIQALQPEIAAAHANLEQDQNRWIAGKAEFLCALHVSETLHIDLDVTPKECHA
jgi:hypothetical protein